MTVFTMLFNTANVLRHGKELKIALKIAWRITGSGEPAFSLERPGCGEHHPGLGSDYHTGSTWVMPGDEYGTGWIFPTAGCWTIHVSRASGASSEFAMRSSNPSASLRSPA